MTPAYAERRVLAVLLTAPERVAETGLKTDDFTFEYHRQIFDAIKAKHTGDLLVLELSDDVSQYAIDLDENWAPENLGAFARIVRKDAEQRRFARAVRKLSGASERVAR